MTSLHQFSFLYFTAFLHFVTNDSD